MRLFFKDSLFWHIVITILVIGGCIATAVLHYQNNANIPSSGWSYSGLLYLTDTEYTQFKEFLNDNQAELNIKEIKPLLSSENPLISVVIATQENIPVPNYIKNPVYYMKAKESDAIFLITLYVVLGILCSMIIRNAYA